MTVGQEESAFHGESKRSSSRADAGGYQGVEHPRLHIQFQAKYKQKQTFDY